ncbi:MAG: hypothetical protein ACUVWN_13240 [bacterium]
MKNGKQGMEEPSLKDTNLLQAIFNALPNPTMIVDSDVRILLYNHATSELVADSNVIIKRRAGEVFHCIRSLEKGCGRSEFCRDCIIRNSVVKSINDEKIYRKQTMLTLSFDNKEVEKFFLITTLPFIYENEKLVIMTLEDISEIIQLKSLIPICVKCKKIRNDKDYWESVESYLSEHLDISFTHSLCPDCLKELYPEIASKMNI